MKKAGFRCVYHGWKFDTDGNCVDMPNEPAESNFRNRIKATAYPCIERGGIIWAYMGPREVPPGFPQLPAFELDDSELESGAAMRDCNWLQGLEGDLDTSHTAFLHSGATKPDDLPEGSDRYYMALHKDPKYVSMDADFGSMYGAYRPAGEGNLYWRIAQFLFPVHAQIPDSWRTRSSGNVGADGRRAHDVLHLACQGRRPAGDHGGPRSGTRARRRRTVVPPSASTRKQTGSFFRLVL